MSTFSGIVVYVLTWWMMFFCILPVNVQSIIEPTDGSMPGAPLNPYLKIKVLVTTLVAGIVWLVIFAFIKSDLVSFRSIAENMAM